LKCPRIAAAVLSAAVVPGAFAHGDRFASENDAPAAETERAETFDEAVPAARRDAWARDEARLRAAYTNCVARLESPAEGIVVPVETYPDGTAKISATAGKAQFFEDEGIVWCGGVKVREYAPDGSVKMECEAAGAIVDRNTRTGWLEGRAKARYGATTLSGCGIYFSFSEEFAKICSCVEIVSSEIKFEGVKL